MEHMDRAERADQKPTTMEASESSLAKAKAQDLNGGFRPHAAMAAVVPPREEDLQKSYGAIVTNDADVKGWYGGMINALGAIIGTMGAVPCCICCPNPYKSVSQGNVGLVTKFGKFYKAVDPGLIKVNVLSEKLTQVDVKIQIVEVPKQTCMTKDNVSVHLTSVIYYHIVAPHKAAFGISNVRQALIERTQTTLRHVVGARVLQDVIERREEIAASIGEIIEDVAAGWGVAVESMLIKDIIFSTELQDSLSMAAQSKRIGESKIIAAKAEVRVLPFLSHTTLASRVSRQLTSPAQTGRIRQADAPGRRHPVLGARHADSVPRGDAGHGQERQQQGDLPARRQPDHAGHARLQRRHEQRRAARLGLQLRCEAQQQPFRRLCRPGPRVPAGHQLARHREHLIFFLSFEPVLEEVKERDLRGSVDRVCLDELHCRL